MVFFNHATRQMTAKIVYYGPGLCGKTTNLNAIYGKTSNKARGEMVSLNTETDRTLFFDLLPMDVGMVGGFKTKLQLYTVPGQVFYNSTRKLVLKGVDGIVFVVDSQMAMKDACKESFQNLKDNLSELGLDIGDIPLVYQWNKRDLKNVVPVEELEEIFNAKGFPSFQSVAQDGTGVFETLRGITKLALNHIKTHSLGEGQPAAKAEGAAPKKGEAKAEAPKVEAPKPEPVQAEAPKGASAGAVPEGALTLSDLPTITDVLDFSKAGTSPAVNPKGEASKDVPKVAPPPAPVDAAATALHMDDFDNHTVPGLTDHGFGTVAPAPKPATPAPPPVVAPPVVVPPVLAPPAVAPAPSAPQLTAIKAPTLPAAPPAPVAPAAPKKQAMPAMPQFNIPKPKAPTAPSATDALRPLLGDLTLAGRLTAPSVIKLDLPEGFEGQDLEIQIQVRHKDGTVAETTVKRAAPNKGTTAKLSLELKRP